MKAWLQELRQEGHIGDGLADRIDERVREMEDTMSQLLKNVGDFGVCRGCNDPIVWLTHRNGKKTPYSLDGRNHFVACVARERFKGGKDAKNG